MGNPPSTSSLSRQLRPQTVCVFVNTRSELKANTKLFERVRLPLFTHLNAPLVVIP